MKNNAFFKFIAIVLCTLCLFGMVTTVAGMLVLANGNLYNRTVDQMLEDRINNDGAVYADYLAREYASGQLGGVPATLIQQQFGYGHEFFLTYDQAHYGYAVLDAQGNEVYGYNAELKNSPNLKFQKSFPVAGNYMHLVSLESQEKVQETLRQNREDLYNAEPTLTLSDNIIPAQGLLVNYAAFVTDTELVLDAYSDGDSTIATIYSSEGDHTFIRNNTQVGLLMFDQTRHLVFHSFFPMEDAFPDREIKEVSFRSQDGTTVRLRSESGHIGTLYCSDGNIRFLSAEAAEAAVPEETVPETTVATIPETVPPTVPETIPEETQAEEVQEEETYEEEAYEEEPSSASAVPEDWETVPPTVPPTEPPTQPPVETMAPTLPPETIPETLPPATEPELINGKPLAEYQLNTAFYWDEEEMEATYVYLPLPELTVELYMEEDALRYAPIYEVLRTIRPFRNYLLPVAAGFALLFVLLGIYLITAAGRKPRQAGVQPGGLNRLPLDLYFVLGGALICGLVAIPIAMANVLLKTDFYLFCGLTAGSVFLACLVFVGFCFAMAAQWKTGGNYAWKNSFCARTLGWLVLAAVWLERFTSARLMPVLLWILRKIGGLLLAIWNLLLGWLKVIGRLLFRSLHRFLHLLPLTWQWLVGGMLLLFIGLLVWANRGDGWGLLWLLLGVGIVLYVSHSFGILADSTRRMSQGDLSTKVDEKNLLGCFKESAADLNALADVAVVAAQKQLKSERMKTELITNVSHDIKTPLTSIINYVDLLQKPHTQLEQEAYLEVLNRQSQRLKKLIDDLMDMSKANTGNMVVEITCLDAVESVNQALGEFADKLDRAQLYPVFRHSVATAPILADGKLVWRVMSNLLGNAVKYAMPGTRLYIDLMALEGKVVVSLKNISREELNVDAEELMERFVRGDDSRNTEGSGLGLNIARSLMELQKGQLQLLVDGDLFKVTLTFPGA